jgi:hypothetical protein
MRDLVVAHRQKGSSSPAPTSLLLRKKKRITSMRRVTSRPRLCSGDDFDAISVVSQDSVDDLMHKERPHCSPGQANDDQKLSLSTLSEDLVALQICSFLSVKDAKAWMQTDRSFQKILRTPFVWKGYVERQWAFLGDCRTKQIVSDLKKPTANPFSDYPLLLRLACDEQSTQIDESNFGYCRVARRRVMDGYDFVSSSRAASSQSMVQTCSLSDGSKGTSMCRKARFT